MKRMSGELPTFLYHRKHACQAHYAIMTCAKYGTNELTDGGWRQVN